MIGLSSVPGYRCSSWLWSPSPASRCSGSHFFSSEGILVTPGAFADDPEPFD